MKTTKKIIEKIFGHKFYTFLKTNFNLLKNIIFKLKMFLRTKKYKFAKKLNIKHSGGYKFAIMCIKKTAYADMIFNNINSLHYQNSNHKIYIYCDKVCFDYIKNNINKFNYKENVEVILFIETAELAWQFYKIEIHILASLNGQIDMDADGIWHKNPKIDMNKITMFLKQRSMSESSLDKNVIKNIFKNDTYINFEHNVASFVYIPSHLMSEELQKSMREINKIIFYNDFTFLDKDDEKMDAKRLSEQYAVNFSIQSIYPNKKIQKLEKGGLGSKEFMEALSYGYLNNVIE